MLGETLMSLFILLGSLFMYYKASQLRQLEAYESVGADFWPKLILFCLIVISTYLTASNAIKWRKSLGEKEAGMEGGSGELGGWIRVSIATFFIVGYVLLLKPVGFIVASPLFIIAMMLLISPEKKKIIPVGVVGIMIIIYVLFGKLLFIPLPKGHGIFRSVSIFLGL